MKHEIINASCSICGNESGYDKESLKGSTWNINGIKVILCCPCEDDLLKKIAKGRGIHIGYERGSGSGEIQSIRITNKSILVKQ